MTADQQFTGALPAADTSGGAPAIDQHTLSQLEQLDPQGTNHIVQRVLQTYERSLVRFMQELATAMQTADNTSIGRLAHTLRSSSASVGALLLSGHCKAVETMIRDGRPEGLQPALQALQIESVRVQAALRAMLRDKGDAK